MPADEKPEAAAPAGDPSAALRRKIETRTARVAVVGLGFVGLPLAVELAKVGFQVTGIDTSPEKVSTIRAGKSDVMGVSEFEVAGLKAVGKLDASTDYAVVKDVDVVVVCVPTPLNKTRDPDVSFILHAFREICASLRPGQLFILESTTYPGTTQEVVLPMLEEGGLRVGGDIFLAFSPERVDPGNKTYTLRNTPKVVGGVTAACTEMAGLFYQQVVSRIVPVSSTQTAEIVKLLENTFRSVNIALVNEVALMCDRLDIDVWEVIDAAATKPFGFMPFYPGPGLGGHCIPIDPHYLAWKLRSLNFHSRFIELASEITRSMPAYVVAKVGDALNAHRKSLKGSSVLVVGASYKPDVNDIRESPALDIMEILAHKGADVRYHDPFVPSIDTPAVKLTSVPLAAKTLASADCVVLTTHHSTLDYRMIAEMATCIVDTRNALKNVPVADGKVTKL